MVALTARSAVGAVSARCGASPRSSPARVNALPSRISQFQLLGKSTLRSAIPARGATLRVAAEAAAAPEVLAKRTAAVREHFPTALPVDDFMSRLEIALYAHGFTGDNSIACANLCRDEVTITVKDKIDEVFGSTFNINGLGAVLTCGVTGVKAGLSHSPLCAQGKERYVFLSMPHIAVNAAGKVGAISRPGRPGESCACGALAASLGSIKSEGLDASCKKPGVHDYNDPELSILKQRLARRMRYENYTPEMIEKCDLVQLTKVAERTICDDLEYLIENAVDQEKADYAVVTAVQVHNWGTEFVGSEPNLEYVAPVEVYVVVGGKQTYIDLEGVSALTPRQVSLLASLSGGAPSSPDSHVDAPKVNN